jgi:hypothetical protein
VGLGEPSSFGQTDLSQSRIAMRNAHGTARIIL